jgi:REP element-mobilizing transposase RayT
MAFREEIELRKEILIHVMENVERTGVYIDFINGYLEHVHCLISLGTGQNIDKILMLLKGESSYWINKNKILHMKFEWQDKYFAASVSEFAVTRIRDYIKNQEYHHKKKSFNDEYQEFINNDKFDGFLLG